MSSERPPLVSSWEWRRSWPDGHPDGQEWPQEVQLGISQFLAEAYDYGYSRMIDRFAGWNLDDMEAIHAEATEEEPSSIGEEGEHHALDVLLRDATNRYRATLGVVPTNDLLVERLTLSSRLGQWMSVVEVLMTHAAELGTQTGLMADRMARDVEETAARYMAEAHRIERRLAMVDQALTERHHTT